MEGATGDEKAAWATGWHLFSTSRTHTPAHPHSDIIGATVSIANEQNSQENQDYSKPIGLATEAHNA